uniref:Uncharacterized protein n=1 Tax=Anguilla anguilla TaxID=7936 RepID=A0A0E9U649_ANGAN
MFVYLISGLRGCALSPCGNHGVSQNC